MALFTNAVIRDASLMARVMEFLTPLECARTTTTSKQWKTSTETPFLWKYFILRASPMVAPIVDVFEKAQKGVGSSKESSSSNSGGGCTGGSGGGSALTLKDLFKKLHKDEVAPHIDPDKDFNQLQMLYEDMFLSVRMEVAGQSVGAVYPMWEPTIVEKVFLGARKKPGMELDGTLSMAPGELDQCSDCQFRISIVDARQGDIVGQWDEEDYIDLQEIKRHASGSCSAVASIGDDQGEDASFFVSMRVSWAPRQQKHHDDDDDEDDDEDSSGWDSSCALKIELMKIHWNSQSPLAGVTAVGEVWQGFLLTCPFLMRSSRRSWLSSTVG